MYNQPVVNAPVVLFLGAGASKPFGKMLMGEFVSHLENLPAFAGESLFREIVNVPDGRDLEHLFEELDEWSRKGYCNEEDPFRGPPAPAGSLAVSPKPLAKRLAERASRMQEDLRQAVFNAYCDIPPGHKPKLVQRFAALFDVLFKQLNPKKSPLVIFTTNYDPAVEVFCQERPGEYSLCDGFVPQPNAASHAWHRESIDHFQIEAVSSRRVVLFKLHGSTNWFKSRDRDGFVKSDVPIYTTRHGTFENLLIYPARRKVALDDPFFTGYDYFQRTLEHCKLCVVIGYSFRDYDALSRLRSASSYNPDLRLLALDPQAQSLCKSLADRGVTAEPVPQYFGAEKFEPDYLDAIQRALSTSRVAAS